MPSVRAQGSLPGSKLSAAIAKFLQLYLQCPTGIEENVVAKLRIHLITKPFNVLTVNAIAITQIPYSRTLKELLAQRICRIINYFLKNNKDHIHSQSGWQLLVLHLCKALASQAATAGRNSASLVA